MRLYFMKRVSFKIAKVLKELSFPQDKAIAFYSKSGTLYDYSKCFEAYSVEDYIDKLGAITQKAAAPTYFEVYLWLWREKNIHLSTIIYKGFVRVYLDNTVIIRHDKKITDPEEAIEKAIEYLVEQNLIK